MKKLIVFDSGYMTHRSIFLWGSQKKLKLAEGIEEDPIPASYGYLNAVYGTLKKIGYTKEDKVLFAQDGWNSFRKAFYLPYKAQRKEFRESHEQINWDKQYKIINNLEKTLHKTTPWNFIQLNEVFNFADLCLSDEGQKFEIENYDIDFATEYGIEADDIMATLPKVFPGYEIILIATDKDLQQLYYYKNLKIFNPALQSITNKAKKGYYEIVNEPLKIISKKIRLGDISDNILVDKKHDTIRDVEIRQFIIDMLRMPEFIQKPIINSLKKLDWDKKVDYDNLPFATSLGKKFDKIYEQKNIRTFEESVERYLLKEMKVIEKRSKKSVEELYEKNENYKKFKDEYDEIKELQKKEKTNAVH